VVIHQAPVEVFSEIDEENFNHRAAFRVIPIAMWEEGAKGVDLARPYHWAASQLVKTYEEKNRTASLSFNRIPHRAQRDNARKVGGASSMPGAPALSASALGSDAELDRERERDPRTQTVKGEDHRTARDLNSEGKVDKIRQFLSGQLCVSHCVAWWTIRPHLT
jgi:hypothetical protein